PRRVRLPRETNSYAAHEAALLGEELLAQHNTRDAEAAFRIALKADPDNPRLVMGLADVFLVADDKAQARHHYEHAVELSPGMACAHNGRGLTADTLDDAEAAFRMALEFEPDNVVYKANLAWALYHLGLKAEAVATFMQVIEVEPHDLGFAKALASILAEDDHLREAEYTLRAALYTDDRPEAPDQAWYMYRLRAFDQAEKLFRKAHRWDYDLAAVFAMHGRLAMAAGMPKIGVVSLKRAVALSPRSERFHRDLAESLTAIGESFLADAARTRAGQMRRARKRTTEQLASWAEDEIRKSRAESEPGFRASAA
ncbi:MAG: tetratricopeptide repeat protein, partial [Deltaproteobacteria bacterium]|nr:tetratricopeptide repeat protein [Deltaproteobacteria bacterium]